MEKIPFLYRMIRGAVGKEYVIKHYKGGRIVKTRFPDMSGTIASDRQKVRRNLFREAVVYARWIIGDEERKRAFRETLPRKKRRNVYQAALQLYMKERGSKLWLRRQLAVMAVVESGRREIVVERGKGEVSSGKMDDGVPGSWRVLWKRGGAVDVLILTKQNGTYESAGWKFNTFSKVTEPDSSPITSGVHKC